MRPRPTCPSLARAAALGVAAIAAGCLDVSVPQQPAPGSVYADFDPSAVPHPLLPAPNDLALDPTSGRVAIPAAYATSDAEKQLADYLSQLDGYPPESVPWLTFSAAIDPASLIGAAQIYDLTVETASPPGFTARWDARTRMVTLTPKSGQTFTPGHRYAVVIVSGADRGVRDSKGRRVYATPAFYLARGDKTLVTCPRDLESPTCDSVTDVLPTKSKDPAAAREERRVAAVALEKLRLSLLPVYDRAAKSALTIARDEIVLAWTFTVSSMPTARFDPDPASKAEVPVPFPNDLLLVGGKPDLPDLDGDPPAIKDLKRALRALDGFSTTAPVRAGVDLPPLPGATPTPQVLDPATLVPANLPLAALLPAAPAGWKESYTVSWEPPSAALRADLSLPLRSRSLYLGAMTGGVRTTTGRPVRASFTTALLRMTAPLVDGDGHSTIRGLADDLAAQAEPARQMLSPVYALAETSLGVARGELAVVFPFTTRTVSEGLPALRALPSTGNTPTAATATVTPVSDFTFVDRLVAGELQVPSRLDGLLGFAAGGKVRLERVPYTLTLPKAAQCPGGGKPPVAVYIHPLGSWRQEMLNAADAFAEHCVALAAIDLPLNGDRSLCLTDGDCIGARNPTCDTGGHCLDCADRSMPATCTPSDLARDPDTGLPLSSGRAFINPSHLASAPDNMLQAVIDTAQFVRVLRAADGPTATPGVDYDPTRTALVGESIGGMIATLALAAIPETTVGVLSTTAADMTDVLLESPTYGPILLPQLAMAGIAPDTRAYREFIVAAKWLLDPAEPMNYGRAVDPAGTPLPDLLTGMPVAPARHVIVQMSGADRVMPNEYTRLLAQLLGLTPADLTMTTFMGSNHAALTNVDDPNFAGVTRQAAVFVASGGTMVLPP